MNDLFVFYQAHNQMGEIRINNAIFARTLPMSTVGDIKDLEAKIAKLYNYRDVKIQNWQRMETAHNDSNDGKSDDK